MRRGVVVVSGTSEISSADMQQKLPAVYRRIHYMAELSWLTKNDIRNTSQSFCFNFFQMYLEKIEICDKRDL